MNSAKYTNQTKPKVTFVSGMAKKGQKSNSGHRVAGPLSTTQVLIGYTATQAEPRPPRHREQICWEWEGWQACQDGLRGQAARTLTALGLGPGRSWLP